MAHTELVPHIGVVDADVGEHQVGQQQFLEHVGADVAGALLLIGAEGLEAGLLQGRPDQALVHLVELDLLPVGIGLGAEGHHHEGVRAGVHGGTVQRWKPTRGSSTSGLKAARAARSSALGEPISTTRTGRSRARKRSANCSSNRRICTMAASESA